MLKLVAWFCLAAAFSSAQDLKDPWQMAQANSLANVFRHHGRVPKHGGQQYPQTVNQPELQPVPIGFDPSQRCDVDEHSRVGCGKPGISQTDCEALNCCYDTRRYIRAPDGPMCYYAKSEGLYKFLQYHGRVPQHGGLRYPQTVNPPELQPVPVSFDPSQRCDVDEHSRVGCGKPGISQTDCEALNCCYDTRRYIRAPDGPMCYYAKSESLYRFLQHHRRVPQYGGQRYPQTVNQPELQPVPVRLDPSQRCDMDEYSRVGCGKPGISQTDCEALNCCYDSRIYIRAPDGPMCYYAKSGGLRKFLQHHGRVPQHGGQQYPQTVNQPELQQPVPVSFDPSQRCVVDEPSRLGCGEPGISQTDCEALNCCYDTRRYIRAPDGPMCYYAKSEGFHKLLRHYGQVPQHGAQQYPQSVNQPELQQPVPVSFDPSQQCDVDEYSRVGCGKPGISQIDCEALNCCYDTRRYIQAPDGPMCYYAKSVTVQCIDDGQFVVVVAREATQPCISLESVTLEAAGEHCTAVDSNLDFIIFQFPFNSCGTKTKVEGDYIVYENMMSSSYEVGVGPHGAVTRDSSYALKFQCKYLATTVASLMLNANTVPPPRPVFNQGPLQVELRLANGVCATKGCSDVDIYSSYYKEADYPVTKVLREPVYVEVRMLQRTDPNIALLLNHCWATSTPDPTSLPRWDLLINGCPYKSDHYLTTVLSVGSSGLQYPTHYKRFIVKMFTFVDETWLRPLWKQVFFHCSTSVCQMSATETCETSCDRTKRSISTTQGLENTALVSSNEVLLIADMPVSAKSQGDGDGQRSQSS
ncbi:zona pellucida glycoprotein 2, like 2 [Hoplias malabaricus]|uniref:zona pellucida glycoprotein 2, like 2 n=1 Tax=Hoplias malabaricus TaxID=27720 RepID=UPI003462A8B0